MKWWEIPQNCNCVFALDANSKTETNKVFFTSNPARFLTIVNNTARVYQSLTSGFVHKNLKNGSPMYNYSYDSLSVDKTNLIFDIPLLLPDNFTIVLKCKVKQNSVLMSNNGSNYGLTFGIGNYEQRDEGYWRVQGFNAGSGVYTKAQLVPYSGNYIQTVVLKGSLSGRDVTFKTDYGSYKVPVDSSAFLSFLRNQTYTHVGYSSSENWQPNLDIIAYGIFDKIISPEEEASVFSSIEDQFFFKKNLFSFNTELNYLTESLKLHKELLKPKAFYKDDFIGVYEPMLLETSFINQNTIKSEVVVKQALYSEFEHIHDVVLEEGVPVKVKLFLYERNTGELVKTTLSDKDGVFSFLNLNKDLEYFITANDNKYQFQSVVKNYNN